MPENRIHTSTKWFIYFYMLHNLRFFQFEPYVNLGNTLIIIDTLFSLYFLFIFLCYGVNMKKGAAWKSITFFYVIFLFSIFNAYLQNGQDLYYGLRGIVFTYMNIGFFYYLSYKRVPIEFLKRLCCFMLISYILVFLVSIIQYPNNVFGHRASIDSSEMESIMERDYEDRGVLRFSFLGGDYIALMLFYVILSRRRIRFGYFFVIALLLLTVARGTRGPIVATIIGAIITYMISNRSKIKSIILTVFIFFSIYALAINIPATSKIINSIIKTTNSEIKSTGVNNVRILSFTYFTTHFNEGKTLPVILGNGVPMKGEYSNKVANANSMGLFENDIEYVQWYLFFGIIGLFALIYWGITFIRLKVPFEYTYIKVFIAYLFIVMVLGSHFFRQVPMIAMLCYMLYYQNITVTYTQKKISAPQ